MSLHIHDNCLPLEYAMLLKKDLNIPAAITIFEQQTTNLKTKDMDIRRTLTALALLLPLSAMAVPTDDDRTGTMTNEPSKDVTTVSFTIDTSVLARIFMDPPKEARPQVWWHWMDGNVSKEGIRKDIEWMKRSGIGGFHQFDAGGINMPRAAMVKLPFRKMMNLCIRIFFGEISTVYQFLKIFFFRIHQDNFTDRNCLSFQSVQQFKQLPAGFIQGNYYVNLQCAHLPIFAIHFIL